MPQVTRAISLLLFAFVFSSVSSSQTTNAALIDEFGRLGCDDLKSRAWNLVTQVKELPESRGFIYVRPPSGNRQIATAQLSLILAVFEFAEIENRVEFRIGDEKNSIEFEFWKIPSGADIPDRAGEKWSPPKPDVAKPFIFGYEDEIGECPTFVPRKFAELLVANSGSRASIVIKSGSRGSAQPEGFADETIKTLVEKFRIDRKRIKTFYIRQKKRNSMTYAEYWFMPARPGRNNMKRLR